MTKSFSITVVCGAFVSVAALAAPRPGEVYREYKRTMREGSDWRVTAPTSPQERAQAFLPNSVLPLRISDLEHAVRAEALIDRWGGHAGTTAKRIRFNGNAWITLPELETTPKGRRPERYHSQDNPIVEIPLDHLRSGENLFEGTSGGQIGSKLDWGQWGWTGIIVRIYYDPELKPHIPGRVTAPGTGERLGENPTVRVETDDDRAVRRVDVLAFYEGYDLDGDGLYSDWQRDYRHNRKGPDGPDEPSIRGHLGTATKAPFDLRWDTRYVPDQPQPTVRILARIQSPKGVWFVTEAISGLRLERPNEAVRLYKPYAVPEKFCARAGDWVMSKFAIPGSDRALEPVEATLHLRTWNGLDRFMWINGRKIAVGGENHEFAYTRHELPVDALRRGENRVEFFSDTVHHCIEILWPGPGVTVRYAKPTKPPN